MPTEGGSVLGGKKISYLVALIAVVLILSGCWKKPATNQTAQEESTGAKVVNSIKDAMGLGQKMECAYEMGIGADKFVSKVWTEGKKYRGETVISGQKNLSLFDGEDLMYNWVEGSVAGTKISVKCMKEIGDSFSKPTEDKATPSEDLGENAFDDVPEANCQPVSAIDFSVPSEITFTDQCAQLKTQMESIKKMQENLPKNINLPEGTNVPEMPTDISLKARQ